MAEPETRLPQTEAVVCLGQGKTRLESLPRPAPSQGEILLRLEGCGLCGTDLFKLAHGGDTPGVVLGHEVVGTVAAVGEGVSAFEMNDRVVTPHHVPCGSCHLCKCGSSTLCPTFREDLLAPGGFSEHFVVSKRAVSRAARKVPDEMTTSTAIFLEPAACVLRGIDRAGLLDLDPILIDEVEILIIGAGSMGLLYLQVLRSVFPNVRCFVSDPLSQRRELAIEFGAIAAVAPDQLESAISRLGTGRGVDTVFDTVGSPEAIAQSLAVTREGGCVVLFAHAKPGRKLPIELNALFKSERRLVGTYSGGPWEQERIWELLTSGRLDPSPIVSHRLPLSRFDEAVELIRNREALKVLLLPEEPCDAA